MVNAVNTKQHLQSCAGGHSRPSTSSLLTCFSVLKLVQSWHGESTGGRGSQGARGPRAQRGDAEAQFHSRRRESCLQTRPEGAPVDPPQTGTGFYRHLLLKHMRGAHQDGLEGETQRRFGLSCLAKK